MKIYLVGGAVRDELLGLNHSLEKSDRDWVVVGASPAEMEQQGFVAVGKDFPVFLHPKTKEEYALARTERKTATGYHGFQFYTSTDVTLEADLARRDLTINAIAKDEFGNLIDPFGGRNDLQAKVLRHVSSAFSEDPVRILRIARFAARYPDFVIASETTALMQSMSQNGEVDSLVAERVWQELSKGLIEKKPSKMFEALRSCSALAKILPEVDRLWGVPQRADYHPEIDTGIHLMMVLDMSAKLNAPLSVRYAALCHDLGKGTTPADILPRHIGHEGRSEKLTKAVSERLRVPLECKELAVVVAREHGNIHRSLELSADAVFRLLVRCDAIRRPQRFAKVLLACECDARGRLGMQDKPYLQSKRLTNALTAALTVDTFDISQNETRQGKSAMDIGKAIDAARIMAIKVALTHVD